MADRDFETDQNVLILEGKVITSANFLFLLRFLLIQLAIKLFMFLHSSDLLIEIHCNV